MTQFHSLLELKTFAVDFVSKRPQGGIIGLTGTLGSGKTTFVRACVEAICEKNKLPIPRIISPTYVVHQSYRQLTPTVDHFDLYRIESADEFKLIDIGYYDALTWANQNSGFLFVEWPERTTDTKVLELSEHLAFTIEGRSRAIRQI